MSTYKLRLKSLLRIKSLIFWTLLFPMLLATFFNLVLRDVYDTPKMEPINVGVVVFEDENAKEFMKVLEKENIVSIINYINEDDATDSLKNKDVKSIIQYNEGFEIISLSHNYNTTLLNTVLNSYNSKINLIESMSIEELSSQLISDISMNTNYTQTQLDDSNNDVSLIHFYSTIAMLCIYASFWGVTSSKYMNAYDNPVGIRSNISPTSKKIVIITDIVAVYTIFIVEFIIHILFLNYVLKVPVMSNILLTLLTGLSGGLLSLMIGYLTGVLTNGNDGISTNFVAGFGVFSSFVAGMNSPEIKILIEQAVPAIKYINPATLISDNFRYILSTDLYQKAYVNILIMILYSLLLGVLAYRKLKVVSYDSL